MSVYKPKGAESFVYDFQLRGRRFCGNTGATSRREAEGIERQRKAQVADEFRKGQSEKRAPMTFDIATSRYWDQVGQHHKGADNTLWSLEWLRKHIGAKKPIREITNPIVAALVATRRADKVAPATVNRSVTEPLRKILRRAAETWEEPVAKIAWRDHMLKEPKERVRELRDDEEAGLFAAIRDDYEPIIRFALMSGCRLSECVGLTWPDVDWGNRVLWITGKGGKRAHIPITPSLRKLLWPLQGHHETAVFTYVAARGSLDVRRGSRIPITREGLKTAWRRLKADIGLADYRFHDNRHTAATRVLRAGGNLGAVRRLLRHEKIDTTMRYAHTTDDDLRKAMEAAVATPSPVEILVEAKTRKSENE